MGPQSRKPEIHQRRSGCPYTNNTTQYKATTHAQRREPRSPTKRESQKPMKNSIPSIPVKVLRFWSFIYKSIQVSSDFVKDCFVADIHIERSSKYILRRRRKVKTIDLGFVNGELGSCTSDGESNQEKNSLRVGHHTSSTTGRSVRLFSFFFNFFFRSWIQIRVRVMVLIIWQ